MVLKAKIYESRMKCNKQKNISVGKLEKSCYENLDLKDITDNEKNSGYCKKQLFPKR